MRYTIPNLIYLTIPRSTEGACGNGTGAAGTITCTAGTGDDTSGTNGHSYCKTGSGAGYECNTGNAARGLSGGYCGMGNSPSTTCGTGSSPVF
jgi:hypothetical protein